MKTQVFNLRLFKSPIGPTWLIIMTLFQSFIFANNEHEIKQILERFAFDYQSDPMFTASQNFGVEVDKVMWSVDLVKRTNEGASRFTVEKGNPASPTFYFVTNIRTLRQLDKGEISALTAGVKAFSTDYAPLDIEGMDGFQPSENFVGDVLSFTFHFWTKGMPEIVPFGQHYTRGTHGAQAAIFYYDTGLRTGYGYLHPGQHANEHPKSKTNPFSSMIILIKGKVTARLNDVDYEIESGNAFFIPPGMSHEVLNPNDEPAEFILLMFGDGA